MIYIYYRAAQAAENGAELCVVRVPGRRPILCALALLHGPSQAVTREAGEVPRLWIETNDPVTVIGADGNALQYDADGNVRAGGRTH